MTSTALYTDVGRVVRALAFQSPETVSGTSDLPAGSTTITVSQNIPSLWQVGDTLAIDANSDTNFEMVTITAIPSLNQFNVTALTKSHSAGAPVVNATAVTPYIGAASRWFDSVTYTPEGFAYETVNETKKAVVDSDGFVLVSLSKPLVDINDVMDVTFQNTPLDPIDTLDVTKAWVESDFLLRIAALNSYYSRSGMATITYNGGFNPIPDDITQAVTVIAARMYKQRDSGYSDSIGSPDTGVMTYQKAMPADVKLIVNKYRRWVK